MFSQPLYVTVVIVGFRLKCPRSSSGSNDVLRIKPIESPTLFVSVPILYVSHSICCWLHSVLFGTPWSSSGLNFVVPQVEPVRSPTLSAIVQHFLSTCLFYQLASPALLVSCNAEYTLCKSHLF